MLKGRSLIILFELEKEGLSFREISKRTGYSRNTLRRYLRDNAFRTDISRKPRVSEFLSFT